MELVASLPSACLQRLLKLVHRSFVSVLSAALIDEPHNGEQTWLASESRSVTLIIWTDAKFIQCLSGTPGSRQDSAA